MKNFFTLVISLLISSFLLSQTTGTIKGKLIDSLSKQSLKDASITVLDAKDSTLEVFTLARPDGSFSLINIPLSEMIVQVTFLGYEQYSKRVKFSKTNMTVDMGNVFMKPASKDLGNVTVTQSAIQMKKDTIEFTASAFKTKPNAVAEDLIRKMPGMEVGKDGSIKSQGEAVQRVLVDGKRFFGDDPKMATKNLPPDIIDKIQVFDDQSDQSKFTGFDDGNRVKTINITIKKDKRVGMFGKAVAGVGTDGTYDGSFNFSRMQGTKQITLLGQGNDINKQNFTQNNIGGGRGGGGGGRGGGNFGGNPGSSSGGITTTWAGGVNYRDAWNDKVDAYGSYFYNNLHIATDQTSNTQNILSADSSTYVDAISSSIAKNANHRLTFNLEDRIDSSNTLIFRPNFAFQSSSPTSISSTTTTAGSKGVKVNESVSKSSSNNSGYSINGANLQLRHRFAKKYRTISLDMDFSSSQNNGDGISYTVNTFYKPFFKADTLNQSFKDSSRSTSFNPTVSYTEPIGKNQVIELRYSLNYNTSTTIQNTYRFDNAGQKYSIFDSLFSNSYKNEVTSNTANLSYRLQNAKYNFNVGTGFQFTDQVSNNTTKNVIVARNYVNFTPTVNFTYNFSKTRNLRFFYNGRTGQPSVTQLQPITTTTDNINFQVGNPNLNPQFTNSFRLLYTSFDPFSQRVIFATVNASVTSDDIVSSIVQKSNGGKVTTYVNMGGTYNLSGYFNYGFPLKKPKSNLNFQTNINLNQSQSVLNTLVNSTRSTILTETVKWTTNLKKNFDMNLSTSYTYNPLRYSLSPEQNSNYTTASLDADFTIYSENGWILSSNFDYTHYDNRPVGFNTTVFLITPAIAKQFLKNNAGEMRLSCFDLLKQNVAISSSASANQLINTRTNNLTQYFMLTFTYNLRSFGAQQQKGQGGMRGMFPGGDHMHGGMGGGGFRRDN